MTDIQIKYWEYVENARHNRVSEGISQGTLDESRRHNVVTENVSLLNLSELNRHNVQTEQVAWKNAASQEIIANASATQARASMIQANAALMNAQSNQRQAAAAESQAASAAIRANAEAAYKTSQTEGQNIANVVSRTTIPAHIVSPYMDLIGTMLNNTSKVLGIAGDVSGLVAVPQ